MSLHLHTIAPKKGARTKSFRIGRGNASGRGTTAGRGTKGQRARTGGRSGLAMKGMKQMILSFPKLRGFQSRYQKSATVSLKKLETLPENTVVTLATLRKANLIARTDRSAKIVGSEVAKKFVVDGVAVSASARQAIEKAGGSIKA